MVLSYLFADNGNDWPIISFVFEQPHHRLRSLNGGNNGRSTNIGIF